jgi:two-component sensor histidine kinase
LFYLVPGLVLIPGPTQLKAAELHEANEHLVVASKEAVHRSKNLLSLMISLAQNQRRAGSAIRPRVLVHGAVDQGRAQHA